ncbi:hypothetical protein [Rubrobacter xylanophilus]|nr:hypothetical protein [Rubrobacter xylanophilus]
MKRVLVLAVAALMTVMVMASAAFAQEDTAVMEQTGLEQTVSGQGTAGGLPSSGGPAVLLPAAALLLGSGILTFAVLRRK